ncbi:MAG: hypothetical protein EP330_11425 [Deltaproteobacteria bacterium]|nr:MAG: hypothetical protein EP330_11425 [Deltaproteobacteria bacterium]
MRRLIYLPFLAVLMGSDCDGGSDEPADTLPPVNAIEVNLAGTQTTLASGDPALTIQWDASSSLSFTGFADDAGGLSQAWLTISGASFAGGNPGATGSGTGLTVTGTPGLPEANPASFTVEMHSRAADGAETHGPLVVVDVTGCVGASRFNADTCDETEKGIFCDLTNDACLDEIVASVENRSADSIRLFPVSNNPMTSLTVNAGDTSTGWAGSGGLRGISVITTDPDFEFLVHWQ